MKVIKASWEKKNLGRNVIEIIIDNNDVFHRGLFNEHLSECQYVVVKVPVNKLEFNFELSSLGFTLIETQLTISKKFKDFNFEDRLIRTVYPHIDATRIQSSTELEEMLDAFSSDMFSTDRIYLDPFFPKEASMIRYKNWIRTEFENNTGTIEKMLYDKQPVGFGLWRDDVNGIRRGLLGGIFKNAQDAGLGILTAANSFMVAKKNNTPFKEMLTTISSNNTPMLQFYNYLGFKINYLAYVFIKHID